MPGFIKNSGYEDIFYPQGTKLLAGACQLFVAAMVSLLETFPDAGVPTVVGAVTCRKLVVKGYNVLYQHESESARVIVLLVYRENIPLLD